MPAESQLAVKYYYNVHRVKPIQHHTVLLLIPLPVAVGTLIGYGMLISFVLLFQIMIHQRDFHLSSPQILNAIQE